MLITLIDKIKNLLLSSSDLGMFISGLGIGISTVQDLIQFIAIPISTLGISVWFRYLKHRQDTAKVKQELELIKAKALQESKQDKERHQLEIEKMKLENDKLKTQLNEKA